MELHVEVTAEDIRRGIKGNCARCPIALACIRVLGIKRRSEYRWVSIAGEEFEFRLGKNEQVYYGRLPDSATDFQSYFDDSEPVAPFSFDVEAHPWN